MRKFSVMIALALTAGVTAASGIMGVRADAAVTGHRAQTAAQEDGGPGVSGAGGTAAGTDSRETDAGTDGRETAAGTDGRDTSAGTDSKGAGAGESTDTGAPVIDGVIQPRNLKAAETADQMIVVVGTGGCYADTYYYKKGEDSWDMVWKEASIVGRGGITSDKKEGDGKTPAGTYGFTVAFGLKEDPGSILSYHKVVKGDYWVDDSSSAYYNKLVNTSSTPKTWNSAENLAAASPYYNYALALDYNSDCVPGKGSAIFLHCFTASADNGSAGCIRLPEARAMELVRTATERTRIVIAEDLGHLQ